jgi:sulfur carrier protein
VQVIINGEARELPAGAVVDDALVAMGVPRSGVAVALDGEVVPRADWPRVRLGDGARLEVLTAVQGG